MNSVTTNSKWLKVDGKKLYEKRRKKNYTREKLSEISGVSENSIKRLEQGIENCMPQYTGTTGRCTGCIGHFRIAY